MPLKSTHKKGRNNVEGRNIRTSYVRIKCSDYLVLDQQRWDSLKTKGVFMW